MNIQKLLEIMALLRDPLRGCSWAKAQTLESIVPHTLEEAYELADAIEQRDTTHIKQELGDVLLQIIFYCQIASEAKNKAEQFNFSDIVDVLIQKLISRNPHVFGDEDPVENAEGQSIVWEQLKVKERKAANQLKQNNSNKILADIPLNLPSLSRAQKLQKRAKLVGFDWPTIEPVLEKLREECDELEQAVQANTDTKAQTEELGDILFTCANIARFLNVDAEACLRQGNQKFEKRFNLLEEKVMQSGKLWDEMSLDDLENIWQEIKNKNLK